MVEDDDEKEKSWRLCLHNRLVFQGWSPDFKRRFSYFTLFQASDSNVISANMALTMVMSTFKRDWELQWMYYFISLPVKPLSPKLREGRLEGTTF